MTSFATILGSLIAAVLGCFILVRAAQRRQRRPQGQADLRHVSPVNFDVPLPEAGRSNRQMVLSCPVCDFEASLEDSAMVGQTVVCPICDQTFEVLEPEATTAATK